MTELQPLDGSVVAALGYRETAAVVGHDFGAGVAAWCALVRPDVFRRLALMSAPFEGSPSLPFATDGKAPQVPESPTIHEALAALPRPRKHYQWWYSTPARQSRDVVLQARRPRFSTRLLPPQERRLERQQTAPARRLDSGRTCQDADLLCDGSRRRHADRRRQADAVAGRDRRLPMAARRGARGLCRRIPAQRVPGRAQLVSLAHQRHVRSRAAALFGKTIDVPSIFISGSSDWGVYQRPGAVEKMNGTACTRMTGVHLLDGAGHWVQQEQPEKVTELLLGFLRSTQI